MGYAVLAVPSEVKETGDLGYCAALAGLSPEIMQRLV